MIPTMNSTIREQAKKIRRGKIISILLAGGLVIVTAFFSLFVGSSGMPFSEGLKALFGNGTVSGVRIMQNIRLPRILAALIAGAGLSVSGLMMQTVLNNPMASPSTLGVSNAAVFGANLSIIGFAGGFLSTGHNPANYMTGANPFAVSSVAFVFAVLSVILILGLSKLRDFSPNVVVLAGIAIGALFTAATTILQFYATDVGLSAAVIWNFGDLGRATYETDLIMAGVVIVGIAFSAVMSWRFNALLSGAETARSMGIRVGVLRFLALFFSSVITAVAVSFLGVIGFMGVICPHVAKKIWGQDHRYAIPASALTGSFLLVAADTLSRTIGHGSALPVGAVTSLAGAPFFLMLIFAKGDRR